MAQDRPRRFRLSRRVLVSIVLLSVVIASVFVYVYYSVGVISVTSVAIDQVFADRKLLNGAYPNRNATFMIEIRVWSTTQYLSVNLERPYFRVDISGIKFGNFTMASGTIYPGSSLVYNLRFTANESSAGPVPFYGSGDPVSLGMTTRLTSGFYSQQATVCDSVTWIWTTASIWSNNGSGFGHCSV